MQDQDFMSDLEALNLLRLLKKYIVSYGGGDRILTLHDMVEDLAMSMDVTSDEADQLRREIEGTLGDD